MQGWIFRGTLCSGRMMMFQKWWWWGGGGGRHFARLCSPLIGEKALRKARMKRWNYFFSAMVNGERWLFGILEISEPPNSYVLYVRSYPVVDCTLLRILWLLCFSISSPSSIHSFLLPVVEWLSCVWFLLRSILILGLMFDLHQAVRFIVNNFPCRRLDFLVRP